MNEEESRRLRKLAPVISQTTVGLLRKVVGLEPAERIPEEAMYVADEVLEKYGTDGLRLLVMSLTGWAAVEIERDAQLSGRTHEALLDDIALTCLEANPDG
ncbi:hypothetical protein GCM10018793_01150 [Streptomyces sulfonofaciens]|uniref:Uncharacterized protein n=1 Tax=Streptomyces sulfonofaciens TaxID=68272 RepID=A0A919FN47_9ACTN|nr:hypothetical protein [Streptomyces sulfonofaciens]GHH69143.1 hypothetical protein GCM10018793_01150 [Streptomyces sulfonofaciens]